MIEVEAYLELSDNGRFKVTEAEVKVNNKRRKFRGRNNTSAQYRLMLTVDFKKLNQGGLESMLPTYFDITIENLSPKEDEFQYFNISGESIIYRSSNGGFIVYDITCTSDVEDERFGSIDLYYCSPISIDWREVLDLDNITLQQLEDLINIQLREDLPCAIDSTAWYIRADDIDEYIEEVIEEIKEDYCWENNIDECECDDVELPEDYKDFDFWVEVWERVRTEFRERLSYEYFPWLRKEGH